MTPLTDREYRIGEVCIMCNWITFIVVQYLVSVENIMDRFASRLLLGSSLGISTWLFLSRPEESVFGLIRLTCGFTANYIAMKICGALIKKLDEYEQNTRPIQYLSVGSLPVNQYLHLDDRVTEATTGTRNRWNRDDDSELRRRETTP